MYNLLESKLIKESWITSEQFIKAKEEQDRIKKSLFSVLIKLGYLSEEDIYIFFSEHSQIPLIRLSDYKLNEELLSLFPEKLYRESLFLPLLKIENTLYVCMATPLDNELINMLKMQTNLDISPLFSYPSSILEAINRFFGPDDEYFNLEDLIVSPQTLTMIPFWRESERLSINLPVELKPDDDRLRLISSSYICAIASDISSSGKAISIKTSIFIPPFIKILIKFPSKDSSYSAKAEVIRYSIEKGGQYLLGLRFLEIKETLLNSILEKAKFDK